MNIFLKKQFLYKLYNSVICLADNYWFCKIWQRFGSWGYPLLWHTYIYKNVFYADNAENKQQYTEEQLFIFLFFFMKYLKAVNLSGDGKIFRRLSFKLWFAFHKYHSYINDNTRNSCISCAGIAHLPLSSPFSKVQRSSGWNSNLRQIHLWYGYVWLLDESIHFVFTNSFTESNIYWHSISFRHTSHHEQAN